MDANLNILYNFIADQNNLIIVGLWAIGFLCKKSDYISDNLITVIITVFSICACIALITPPTHAILRGFIYAAVAVYVHSLGLKPLQDYIISKLGDKKDDKKE